MILQWLLPLGMLGLLSIAALIIIYLIKPQFKERRISSTVVWKRVLLHKKKQLPVINHLLILLLQALALACIALSLAQPYLFSEDILLKDAEHVIILDASASMLARPADDPSQGTRFERAKSEAQENIAELFQKRNGSVYVILADNDPDYIVSGLGRDDRKEIDQALEEAECTYGEADIETALTMAQERLKINPYAKIFLLTDMQFGKLGTAVTVTNFADSEREWNVAITDCQIALRDNEWTFTVSMSAYGDIALKTTLRAEIIGASNDDGEMPKNYELEIPVTFQVNANSATHETVQTITFTATNPSYGGQESWFFESFDEVQLRVPELGDSIPEDDTFYVYGGIRDRIRVEYASSDPNIFWQLGFANLGNNMMQKRRIDYREIYQDLGETPEGSGYDIYVFEHSIPFLAGGLPNDGLVVLMDPDASISSKGIGISTSSQVTFPTLTPCSAIAEHPLLDYIDPARIGLTAYKKLTVDDPMFLPILYCGEDPVAYVKNTGDTKILVLSFSINNSNFYGREFQIFLRNVVEYFFPVTLNESDFSVGESAQVQCKGISVEVTTDTGETKTLTSFPSEYEFSTMGTYTFTTKFAMKKPREVRKAYVHMPAGESALFSVADFRMALDNQEMTGEVGTDLFIYLAIALLVLIMTEWYLQFKYIV